VGQLRQETIISKVNPPNRPQHTSRGLRGVIELPPPPGITRTLHATLHANLWLTSAPRVLTGLCQTPSDSPSCCPLIFPFYARAKSYRCQRERGTVSGSTAPESSVR
jgi:hypothetical protein